MVYTCHSDFWGADLTPPQTSSLSSYSSYFCYSLEHTPTPTSTSLYSCYLSHILFWNSTSLSMSCCPHMHGDQYCTLSSLYPFSILTRTTSSTDTFPQPLSIIISTLPWTSYLVVCFANTQYIQFFPDGFKVSELQFGWNCDLHSVRNYLHHCLWFSQSAKGEINYIQDFLLFVRIDMVIMLWRWEYIFDWLCDPFIGWFFSAYAFCKLLPLVTISLFCQVGDNCWDELPGTVSYCDSAEAGPFDGAASSGAASGGSAGPLRLGAGSSAAMGDGHGYNLDQEKQLPGVVMASQGQNFFSLLYQLAQLDDSRYVWFVFCHVMVSHVTLV